MLLSSPQVRSLHKNTKLHFKHLKKLPIGMRGAQAVMYKETLYVGGGYTKGDEFTLFMYQLKPDTWGTVKTPTRYYTLAVYKDHLLLAGGLLPSETVTDQLWLTDNQQYTFEQTIPPMKTPTYAATAITTEEHLIIAAGYDGHNHIDVVQVYSGKQWTLAQPLPISASRIKYTFLNDILYLIGGNSQDKKIFYASLPAVLGSVHQLKTPQESIPTVWNRLADAPLRYSSIAVLRSELVTIGSGGMYSPSPFLHVYSQRTQRWEKMEATLPRPLHGTCSISPSTGELMVIGGEGEDGYSAHLYTVSVVE